MSCIVKILASNESESTTRSPSGNTIPAGDEIVAGTERGECSVVGGEGRREPVYMRWNLGTGTALAVNNPIIYLFCRANVPTPALRGR